MTDPVYLCPEHGHDTEETCPYCEGTGERLLSGPRREQLSKFVSGALRHFPDDAGLTLDEAGWTTWESLVGVVSSRYDWAGEQEVEAVVATDPKGRFETRESGGERQVRAAYGHSVAVDLDADSPMASTDLPEALYHGTAPRNVDAILDEGLKPMNRQLVHLSGTRETAQSVGQRHTAGDAAPVVLRVDVRSLVDAGFDLRKRGADTYTVAQVPPRYLSRDERCLSRDERYLSRDERERRAGCDDQRSPEV